MAARFRPSFALVLAVAIAIPFAAGAKTINVDCPKKSINTALQDDAEDLVIEFTGTCEEDVLIRRDGVTLRGLDASALIAGAPGVPPASRRAGVTVIGASNVLLTSFTVDDSDSRGIDARGASRLTIDGVTATGNGDGLILLEQSAALIRDSHFDGNRSDGIGAWDNSAVTFEGTNSMNSNGRAGILASGGSSLSLSVFGAHTTVDGSRFGICLQLGATSQMMSALSHSTTISNSLVVGLSVLGSSWASPVTVSNTQYCIDVESNSTLSTNATISGCSVVGLSVDASTVELNSTAISGSGDTDVVLDFGSRLSAFGSSAGTVYCGDGIVTRGGISCPASLLSASSLSARTPGRTAGRPKPERREPLLLVE
jgi:Right handed beta helix region